MAQNFPHPIRYRYQWLRLLPGLLFWLALLPPGYGQSKELYLDRGAVGLSQSLKRLPLISRVLFVMAHPDDEPAGLVTYVSRGLGARTAILSLTRGEGGQNLVGPDLFEALGLVRTGEMLAANEFYGASQYFSRAFDFGFSRSAEETLDKWGRQRTLEDLVRTIRSFRPLVILSVFSGTPADGHGHHRACGLLAREAFDISGQPDRFPELTRQGLPPWKAARLYLRNRGEDPPGTFSIDTGAYDPWLGASFRQLGAQGYSLHRSQGMGRAHALPGSHPVKLRLGTISPYAPLSGSSEASFEEALELKLPALAELWPAGSAERAGLGGALQGLATIIERARSSFSPSDPSRCMPVLTVALKELRAIQRDWTGSGEASSASEVLAFFLKEKEQDILEAFQLASGLSLGAYSDRLLLTPGQSFRISVKVVNRSRRSLRLQSLQVESEVLRTRALQSPLPMLLPGQDVDLELGGEVPPEAEPSRPHLRRPRGVEDFYTVDDPALTLAPAPPPLAKVRLGYVYRGERLEIEQPVEYLDVDRLKGTRPVPIHLVPPIQLEVSPPLHLAPLARAGDARTIRLRIRNNSPRELQGRLELQAPKGWKVEPAQAPFALARPGQAVGIPFRVSADSGALRPGRVSFRAVAGMGGTEITRQYRMISVFDRWSYPLYSPARSQVEVLDLQVPTGLRVGYIMGAGDRVSQTLSQLGFSITALGPEDLAAGELGDYDCIIAGIRAYQVRNDLIEHNARLLDYVREGGVFIVQYNTPYAWNRRQYAPFPARIVDRSHRVTDEKAPVTLLEPEHRVFRYPNPITRKDFAGWVQERGLYFIQERDGRFRALLASHDPGEPLLDGGLLIADYGKGRYVLTSYSWFRQLPAGVAGAIRLFTNLVSLGADPKYMD